jgi:hypothetical protein
MTLERLQLIATTATAPPYKVRWLTFWNSGFHTLEALYFFAKGFIDKELEAWLNRASFWIGVRKNCS